MAPRDVIFKSLPLVFVSKTSSVSEKCGIKGKTNSTAVSHPIFKVPSPGCRPCIFKLNSTEF